MIYLDVKELEWYVQSIEVETLELHSKISWV